MKTPTPIEGACGKYLVRLIANEVQVSARKEDSPFYVPQHLFVENTQDLEDLRAAINAVLAQTKNEPH